MKDITFKKYFLQNGFFPLLILSILTVPIAIIEIFKGYKEPWIWVGVVALIWSLTIFGDYVIWKTGISDLFAAIKVFFKKK